MPETRLSHELMRDGALPPCHIDDHGGAPIHGSGCEGVLSFTEKERRFDHTTCPGWWREAPRDERQAPGFRCQCECHRRESGWPGWDAYVRGL